MLNVLFAYCVRFDTATFLLSLFSIIIVSVYYVYVVAKKYIQEDLYLYSGTLGLYEVLHCSVIVSYRIGKTPLNALFVLFIISFMFCLIFLGVYFIYKRSLGSSKSGSVSAVALFPAAFIGITLHRFLVYSNFNYIIELILLLVAFCFSFYFINLIKYMNKKNNTDDGSLC
jgi:hypothetical protein